MKSEKKSFFSSSPELLKSLLNGKYKLYSYEIWKFKPLKSITPTDISCNSLNILKSLHTSEAVVIYLNSVCCFKGFLVFIS